MVDLDYLEARRASSGETEAERAYQEATRGLNAFLRSRRVLRAIAKGKNPPVFNEFFRQEIDTDSDLVTLSAEFRLRASLESAYRKARAQAQDNRSPDKCSPRYTNENPSLSEFIESIKSYNSSAIIKKYPIEKTRKPSAHPELVLRDARTGATLGRPCWWEMPRDDNLELRGCRIPYDPFNPFNRMITKPLKE